MCLQHTVVFFCHFAVNAFMYRRIKRVKEAQKMILDFCSEIAEIVRSNLAPKKMQEKICDYHEKDIALALELLTKEECQRLFRILPMDELARVLEYAEEQVSYFTLLNIKQKTEVLSCMEVSEASEILQALTKDERAALIGLMTPETREELNLIGSFDEDEIGSRISTNYIEIEDTATVKEAMSQLIEQAAENDNISILYLADKEKNFSGAIDLKDLIVAREGTPLSEITTLSYPYLYARTSIEECIPFLRDYSETSIPVLDDENKLIGVVTAQDFVEILGDEFGEDYAKLGGLSSEEDLEEPVLKSVKKRMPWLCALLAMGIGVSAAVGLFESIVAQLPVIMCFQSLILDMAGNVGTQSLAVAIRVLMDHRVGRKQKAVLVWKEVRIGLVNGSVLGILSFVVIGIYLCIKGNGPMFAFAVSACLGISMVLTMVISSLSGTLIPLFFKGIGIDPAVASGPLITTINDLVAVIAYYGLSWLILLNILSLT